MSSHIHLDEHDKRWLKHSFGRYLREDAHFEAFVSAFEAAVGRFARRFARIADQLEPQKQIKELRELYEKLSETVNLLELLHFKGDKRVRVSAAIEKGHDWHEGGQQLKGIGSEDITQYLKLARRLAAAAKDAAKRSEEVKDRKDGTRELESLARSALKIIAKHCREASVADAQIRELMKRAAKKASFLPMREGSYQSALVKARVPLTGRDEASADAED